MKKKIVASLLLLMLATGLNAQQAGFGLYANMGVGYQHYISNWVLSHSLSGSYFAFNGHLGGDYIFTASQRFRVLADAHYLGSPYAHFLSANAGFQVKTGSYPNYLGLTAGYQFFNNLQGQDGLVFGLVNTTFIPLHINTILPFVQVEVDVALTTRINIGLTAGVRLNINSLNNKEN